MTFRPPDVRHLPLPVLHAEATFAVVVKPAGLLSIPGRQPDAHDSVSVRVTRLFPEARGPIVAHRLDMATSGVMIVALTAEAHRRLSVAFQEHRVRKTYVALIDGTVDGDEGVVDLPLRPDLDRRPLQVVDRALGRPCVTRWRVLAREPGWTRVALEPLTGRTHQLRVHAAAGLGHAIVGDRLYGRGAEQYQPDRARRPDERAEGLCPAEGHRAHAETQRFSRIELRHSAHSAPAGAALRGCGAALCEPGTSRALGGPWDAERLMLHAESLELAHPETGAPLRFSSAAPF